MNSSEQLKIKENFHSSNLGFQLRDSIFGLCVIVMAIPTSILNGLLLIPLIYNKALREYFSPNFISIFFCDFLISLVPTLTLITVKILDSHHGTMRCIGSFINGIVLQGTAWNLLLLAWNRFSGMIFTLPENQVVYKIKALAIIIAVWIYTVAMNSIAMFILEDSGCDHLTWSSHAYFHLTRAVNTLIPLILTVFLYTLVFCIAARRRGQSSGNSSQIYSNVVNITKQSLFHSFMVLAGNFPLSLQIIFLKGGEVSELNNILTAIGTVICIVTSFINPIVHLWKNKKTRVALSKMYCQCAIQTAPEKTFLNDNTVLPQRISPPTLI